MVHYSSLEIKTPGQLLPESATFAANDIKSIDSSSFPFTFPPQLHLLSLLLYLHNILLILIIIIVLLYTHLSSTRKHGSQDCDSLRLSSNPSITIMHRFISRTMGAHEAASKQLTDSIDIVFHVWPHCEDCRGGESRY